MERLTITHKQILTCRSKQYILTCHFKVCCSTKQDTAIVFPLMVQPMYTHRMVVVFFQILITFT